MLEGFEQKIDKLKLEIIKFLIDFFTNILFVSQL